MSGLKFTLKAAPTERLDLSGLTGGVIGTLSADDAARVVVGRSKLGLKAADVFSITGDAGDTLVIEGTGTDKLDYVAAGLTSGSIIIDGPVGAYAGRQMKGGKLTIKGDAGGLLASGLSDGLIHVMGSVGDELGAVSPGDRFGMLGGIVVVEGNVSARTGDKMRRGTIIVRGKTGDSAGSRMIGGTIWAEGGFGPAPGLLMRRGTLIGPSAERLLPTFGDCGVHDLLVLRILAKYLKEQIGALAPKPFGLTARKFAGDMSTIGKGEILLSPTA